MLLDRCGLIDAYVYPSGRKPIIFTAIKDGKVLKSTAASIIDKHTLEVYGLQIELDGGGIQYFSPQKDLWKMEPR